jgi:hypothetical protein
MLHRFWLSFTQSSSPSVLNLGCGVTGYDQQDALNLVKEMVFSIYGPREIVGIVEDVDISTLDANHVRPKMGLPIRRGVWFPLL